MGRNWMRKMLQQFLSIFKIMSNLNTRSGMLPAELIFTRKIKSVFNKILLEQKPQTPRNIPMNKYLGRKDILQDVPKGKRTWKDGVVK